MQGKLEYFLSQKYKFLDKIYINYNLHDDFKYLINMLNLNLEKFDIYKYEILNEKIYNYCLNLKIGFRYEKKNQIKILKDKKVNKEILKNTQKYILKNNSVHKTPVKEKMVNLNKHENKNETNIKFDESTLLKDKYDNKNNNPKKENNKNVEIDIKIVNETIKNITKFIDNSVNKVNKTLINQKINITKFSNNTNVLIIKNETKKQNKNNKNDLLIMKNKTEKNKTNHKNDFSSNKNISSIKIKNETTKNNTNYVHDFLIIKNKIIKNNPIGIYGLPIIKNNSKIQINNTKIKKNNQKIKNNTNHINNLLIIKNISKIKINDTEKLITNYKNDFLIMKNHSVFKNYAIKNKTNNINDPLTVKNNSKIEKFNQTIIPKTIKESNTSEINKERIVSNHTITIIKDNNKNIKDIEEIKKYNKISQTNISIYNNSCNNLEINQIKKKISFKNKSNKIKINFNLIDTQQNNFDNRTVHKTFKKSILIVPKDNNKFGKNNNINITINITDIQNFKHFAKIPNLNLEKIDLDVLLKKNILDFNKIKINDSKDIDFFGNIIDIIKKKLNPFIKKKSPSINNLLKINTLNNSKNNTITKINTISDTKNDTIDETKINSINHTKNNVFNNTKNNDENNTKNVTLNNIITDKYKENKISIIKSNLIVKKNNLTNIKIKILTNEKQNFTFDTSVDNTKNFSEILLKINLSEKIVEKEIVKTKTFIVNNTIKNCTNRSDLIYNIKKEGKFKIYFFF